MPREMNGSSKAGGRLSMGALSFEEILDKAVRWPGDLRALGIFGGLGGFGGFGGFSGFCFFGRGGEVPFL